MSHQSPILIIGAGVSGLALAQGLLNSSIPFHIYERDASGTARSQGYRVRINDDGIKALQYVLPPAVYAKFVDCCAISTSNFIYPTVHMDASTAKGVQSTINPPPPRPNDAVPLNVDRSVCRSVLMQGLQDHISFCKTFVSYTIDKCGVTVSFADGTSARGSLLIGCDGAYSRVRSQLLPSFRLLDTQARCIFGKTALTPALCESFNSETSTKMSLVTDFTSSTPLCCLLEPVRFKDNKYRSSLPQDYMYWVVFTRTDNPLISKIGESTLLAFTSAQSLELARQLTEKWHPSFTPLFSQNEQDNELSVIRIATVHPKIEEWDGEGKVTIMGDAAHVMSPTGAAGAATAFRDAATLLKRIKEGLDKESLEGYEKEMRDYAGKVVAISMRGGKMLFGMKDVEELPYTEKYVWTAPDQSKLSQD